MLRALAIRILWGFLLQLARYLGAAFLLGLSAALGLLEGC